MIKSNKIYYILYTFSKFEYSHSTSKECRHLNYINIFQQNFELQKQLSTQQKLLERHSDNLQRCVNMNKKLLIEKVKNNEEVIKIDLFLLVFY